MSSQVKHDLEVDSSDFGDGCRVSSWPSENKGGLGMSNLGIGWET